MLQNPLVIKFVGQLLRWVLGPLAALLVAKGIITAEDSGQYVDALTSAASIFGGVTFLAQLLWGLYEKYKSQQKLATALSMGPTTEAKLEDHIASGTVAAASTPKQEVPIAVQTPK